MKKAVILTILCTQLMACANKNSEDIENEMATGVVLVQNESYYEVVLPNGESIYFSSYNNEEGFEGLTDDKDSVEQALSYGTGFFISDKGQIATNMHVVTGDLGHGDIKDIKSDLASFFDDMKEYIKEERNETSMCYDELEDILIDPNDEISQEEYGEIAEIAEQLEEDIEEYDETLRELEHLNMEDAEIKCHCKVSIAYNDTHVTGTEDFMPCVITKMDEEHDLAIIELKEKKTPQDRHVFVIPEKDPLEEYGLMDKITKVLSDDKNSQLHMTSFNYGPILAMTKVGVKSQFNIGTISQRTNDEVMYSIPALSGSSGSPVVNRCGELVAINHAGLADSQNFNYGIKVKHLRNLVEQ